MDSASISRIEEWDSRPVPGGYAGLNDLAESGFTGAVAAGGTRLVMLNGRVVGVFDGQLSAFEAGEATAFEAPDPALPLLIAMRERDGEVRGSYYTDDTPIREVDETLTSGGFTGYLELSENVLSGDYFVVYYGGRSLSVAFVGNNRRVVTGEEAMELAADEVGIYEVKAVDLEVTDVPEAPEGAGAVAAAGSAAAVDADPEGTEPVADEPAADEGGEEGRDGGEDDERADADPSEPAEGAVAEAEEDPPEPAPGTADDAGAPDPGDAEEEPPEVPVTEAEPDALPADEEPPTEAPAAADDTPGAAEPGSGSPGPGGPAPAASEGAAKPREPADRGDPSERFEEEARWREARTVPALDPEESEAPGERLNAGATPAATEADPPPERETTAPGGDVEALEERVRRLESELQASEERRRRLDEQLEASLEERDDAAAEVERLEARISELEARLAESESDPAAVPDQSPAGSGTSDGRAVEPVAALDQTDLFVRYSSKGQATLRSAHDGQAGRDDVAENLRIETHSRFDAATATVEGRPFDEFLEGTIQYRFVSWLVEELLYEIQDTGSESALRALYDVLPAIDRAEFNGTVTGRDEEGDEHTESFDVVCRDRMGKPLVVANINDSLDPATGDMMVRLVEDGTAAAESHESIGAAFFVTASFFQPEALETVADATRGGGLLSRDSRKSFVKLARNGGYHLCLVEARGDDFHVAVPEF